MVAVVEVGGVKVVVDTSGRVHGVDVVAVVVLVVLVMLVLVVVAQTTSPVHK